MLDAGEQDAGWVAGSGQLSLCCCLFEELTRLVAPGFGVVEGGGEGGPGCVGEDAVGVVG